MALGRSKFSVYFWMDRAINNSQGINPNDFGNPRFFLLYHRELYIYASVWNISATRVWVAVTYGYVIHACPPQDEL